MSDLERLARIGIALVSEPGDLAVAKMVHDEGPEAVFDALRTVTPPHPSYERCAEVLGAGERDGMRYLIPSDEEWPAPVNRLEFLARDRRGGVPLGLWVKGLLRLDTLAGPVAIVGSRSATTYGADVAADMACSLAEKGRPIVSGAAFGIDQAAHRGALAGDGRTVAVLACGVDRVYPAAHRQLIERIGKTGALVSEQLPGTSPTRVRFLGRNRIIAALSSGTVVVEAALRSGSLCTAQWATAIGAPLFAVPGPVTSAASVGSHGLIRRGEAHLVTSGAEVHEWLQS